MLQIGDCTLTRSFLGPSVCLTRLGNSGKAITAWRQVEMLVSSPRKKTIYFTCHPRKTGLPISPWPWCLMISHNLGHKNTLSIIHETVTLLQSDEIFNSVELSVHRGCPELSEEEVSPQEVYCFSRCQVLEGWVSLPDGEEVTGTKSGAKDIIKDTSIYIASHSTPSYNPYYFE